jgi:hypothetical protein
MKQGQDLELQSKPLAINSFVILKPAQMMLS